MGRTRGDVFRVNITPPANTFPWIRIFLHEYGIKESGKSVSNKIGATRGKSRDEVAREIGKEIIKHSRILSAWFQES